MSNAVQNSLLRANGRTGDRCSTSLACGSLRAGCAGLL